MLFLNNKRAWFICVLSLLTAAGAFFIWGVDKEVFAFAAIQIILLLLSGTESVKLWCMNYKISVMKSENQYYMMIFFGILLLFFVEVGFIIQGQAGG